MLGEAAELFILTPLDKVVAFPVALYHLEKSGDHNDIEARAFEVLLCVASCSECLRASKVPNLPPSCNSFCHDCFRNKSVCDNHTDLYNSLNCDVRPCETCERPLKESKSLVYKEFCNLLSIKSEHTRDLGRKFLSFLVIPC